MIESGPILAIDQGSSATKAGLLASDGTILRSAEAPLSVTRNGARVEHDPEAIWTSVRTAVRELDIESAEEPPLALALACQRSTCLLWERQSGEAISPALSWQDTRTAAAVDDLAALRQPGEMVIERTGLRLSPHYAGPKLSLLLDSTPGARRRAEGGEVIAGTLDAFLVQKLTGEAWTEPGCAGRTLLYNLEADNWDDQLCALFAVPRRALPALRPSAGDWGRSDDALPGCPRLPLRAVLGDQQAALLAYRGWEGGTVIVHFGTGAFALASTGERLGRHPGLLAAVLAATRRSRHFQLEAPVNSAGSAIDWATRLSGEDLASWGERSLDYERLPLFVPAFSGLAAPWWEPRARAMVSGLTLEQTGASLLAAAMLGVAQRAVDALEALAAAGCEPEIVLVSGKLTRLAGLVQALADLGRRPVGVLEAEETGLLGVAILARAALGGSLAGPVPKVVRRFEPELDPNAARLLRSSWRELVREAIRHVDSPEEAE